MTTLGGVPSHDTPPRAVAVLLAIAAAGPIGYPAWLALVTGRRRAAVAPEPGAWPDVTVIVPAFREQAVIEAKVADVRANGYPGSLRVLVVADDAETAAVAQATGVDVLAPGRRVGKAAAINAGAAAAADPIVVLTDANAMLSPGALALLVRWFDDPAVGAVAGEKRVAGEGQGAYWRYESWLKRRESARGSTVGLVGELAAVRRELLRPLPEDVSVDDLWIALDVLGQGRRIVYEPDAQAVEEPSPTWRTEWDRRTRVVCGVLDVLWRRPELSLPGRGPVWAELWGHRLLRSSAGPVAHALLLLLALRRVRRSAVAAVFAGGHALAAGSAVRQARGADLRAPERLAVQVLFLQAVALGGLTRFLRGERPALWRKEERSTPSGVTPRPAPTGRPAR